LSPYPHPSFHHRGAQREVEIRKLRMQLRARDKLIAHQSEVRMREV